MKNRITAIVLSLLVPAAQSAQAFTNGQDASYVLGQPDFVSSGFSGATVTSIAQPQGGLAYDSASKRLFVADTNHHRVLVYSLASGATNGMNASFVLGQPDFVSDAAELLNCGDTISPNTLVAPKGLAYDAAHQRLFVSEQRRILVFDLSGGITNGMAGSYAFAEANDLTSCVPRMGPVSGLHYDPASQRLFAADTFYKRVLVFDMAGVISNGMTEAYILADTGMAGTSAHHLNYPMDVDYDPTAHRLFVADKYNNRVLVFEFPGGVITTGMDASYVLGQPDFTTGYFSSLGANTLMNPSGVSFDPGTKRLFVSERSSPRVVAFNLAGGITNGMAASEVLGQSDMTSQGGSVSAHGMGGPQGLLYDASAQRLFVADYYLNRVTLFAAPGCGSPSVCGVVKAWENPNPTLENVMIELRDRTGKFLGSTHTDSQGHYSFDTTQGIVQNETFIVTPVVDRNESAMPFQIPAPHVPADGVIANFQIRGQKGALKVAGLTPGSLVMFTPSSYTGTGTEQPPTLRPGASESASYVTTTVGRDGQISLPIATGSYFLTCWKAPEAAETEAGFVRIPAVGSSGPYTLAPGESQNVTCENIVLM